MLQLDEKNLGFGFGGVDGTLLWPSQLLVRKGHKSSCCHVAHPLPLNMWIGSRYLSHGLPKPHQKTLLLKTKDDTHMFVLGCH